MRSRLRSQSGSRARADGRPLELVRVRGSQRRTRDESGNVKRRTRRRGGRGRGGAKPPAPPRKRFALWSWLRRLFGGRPAGRAARAPSLSEQEARVLTAFQQHYRLTFSRVDLLKLALTHRSYLSVTGQGPRESNERLEFLGDSVLGLVTSEFLYRENPTEHEGQLTKTKSLLVSKAILSRRALAMGLGRFVLMSHSEVESGGRQRLSIIADAFESVVGAIYLDQGFEAARAFIHRWLLRDSSEIVADKRHTNYKSHLQEYVQSTFHTHPVYRIRGEAGPDHSKHFQVEVMVGKRVLGEGRGRNKKEAEQAAARDALERLEGGEGRRRPERSRRDEAAPTAAPAAEPGAEEVLAAEEAPGFERRSRRGGRRTRTREDAPAAATPAAAPPPQRPAPSVPEEPLVITPPPLARLALPEEPARPAAPVAEVEPPPPPYLEDEFDEVGRPEGPLEERHVDPYGLEPEVPEEAEADWEAGRAGAPMREPVAGYRPAEPPRHPLRDEEGFEEPETEAGRHGRSSGPVEVAIEGDVEESAEPIEVESPGAETDPDGAWPGQAAARPAERSTAARGETAYGRRGRRKGRGRG